MGIVYRYTDLEDGIIKYVGIIWSEKRSLKHRVAEHEREERFKGKNWKIEYIVADIRTRTDAEYLESHYISLYHTDNYMNDTKIGWGTSSFLMETDKWNEYDPEGIPKNNSKVISVYTEIRRLNQKIENLKVISDLATKWLRESEMENKQLKQELNKLKGQ